MIDRNIEDEKRMFFFFGDFIFYSFVRILGNILWHYDFFVTDETVIVLTW